MNEQEVRLHDVTVSGDGVDRSAVLAAIERAVADATLHGSGSPGAVRGAGTAAVGESRHP